MTLPEAVRAIIGNTDLMAVLPGPVGAAPRLWMGQGITICDIRNGNARRFLPKYSDVVSIEWTVLQISVQAQKAELARVAAAKAERGE